MLRIFARGGNKAFRHYTNIHDADLKELARLKGLRSLELGGNQVAAIKGPQSLGFSNTIVTDAGLKYLAALKNLQAGCLPKPRWLNSWQERLVLANDGAIMPYWT